MSRFAPVEYKSEGGFNLLGLPILLGALCAAAVALGWLASFIGQWFYLIFLFPVGIGLGLVFVGAFVGHQTKMRNPFLACVFGLICSAVAMLTIHYCNYQRFLDDRQKLGVVPFLPEKMPANLIDPKLAEILQHMKQARAVADFPDFLNLEAMQGVTISSRGGSGFNLGYVGTWIYWGVELFGVAAIVSLALMGSAAVPFCSVCNLWKEDRNLGTLRRHGATVAALVKSGEIERLTEQDAEPAAGLLILTAAVCPRCGDAVPIAVKLEEEIENAKGEKTRTELAHVTYPGDALAAFERIMSAKKKSYD